MAQHLGETHGTLVLFKRREEQSRVATFESMGRSDQGNRRPRRLTTRAAQTNEALGRIEVFRYDSRADPAAFDEVFAWRADRVVEFWSGYALTGREFGEWRVAARAEFFGSDAIVNNTVNDPNYGEDGHALTFAAT